MKITFSMIKPHIVASKQVGAIITMIENAGFIIKNLKKDQLDLKTTQKFYQIHAARPFYDELCAIISSGPVIAMILEKNDNIVSEFRQFIGNTDPALAEAGSVRAKYGTSIDLNAIHGSDSDENAIIERGFFF